MLTTWPALTEAMYLLGEAGGWTAQQALWSLVESGDLKLAELTDALMHRARELMEKYRDCPMDLADATLVAVAESRRLRDIFTLDQQDFRVYRPAPRQAFRFWP